MRQGALQVALFWYLLFSWRIMRYCLILFCIKSIASKGRPEGFQRAIGKPFGRARRRETSDLGKAIVLSENSIRNTAHSFPTKKAEPSGLLAGLGLFCIC